MWFANQWSSCSSKCKGVKGIHTRKVMCGVMKVIPPPSSNTSTQTNDGKETETEASGDQDVAEGSSERKKRQVDEKVEASGQGGEGESEKITITIVDDSECDESTRWQLHSISSNCVIYILYKSIIYFQYMNINLFS